MNKPLMVMTIRKLIRKKGISDDLIDVNAYVDSSLSLKENWEIIKNDLKFIVSQENKNKSYDSGTKSINKNQRYLNAVEIFTKRRKNQIRLDSLKLAKRSFDIKSLTKINYNKWKKNPNKYDIDGIDNKNFIKFNY